MVHITKAIQQQVAGLSVSEVCRNLGIAKGTFYRWKKDYGGLKPSQVRELKQLRDKCERLKKLVADISLDEAMLQNVKARK
jgi:putative transposase